MAKMMMMMMLMLISLTFTTLSGASMHVPASAPSPYSEPMMGPAAAGEPMAPAPAGMDCTDALLNMTACLTYVEEGSNQTVPDTGCCPGLSDLITNQPLCLCQLLASGNAFGVKLDTTKALMLPNVCKLQAPPVSLCAVLGIPVASPTGPSAAPSTSGGAEAPSSGASSDMAGSTPIAAPSTGNTGSSSTGTAMFSLLALTAFSVIAAIF